MVLALFGAARQLPDSTHHVPLAYWFIEGIVEGFGLLKADLSTVVDPP
jgi:hypothetical protein